MFSRARVRVCVREREREREKERESRGLNKKLQTTICNNLVCYNKIYI